MQQQSNKIPCQEQQANQSGASSSAHISIAEPAESRPHSPFNLYHEEAEREKKMRESNKRALFRQFVRRQIDKIKAKWGNLEEVHDERKGKK